MFGRTAPGEASYSAALNSAAAGIAQEPASSGRADEVRTNYDYHVSMEISLERLGRVLGWMAFRTTVFGSQLVSASDEDICRPISLGLGVRIVGRQQRDQGP